MGTLTITGNLENLKKLRKLNRGFASRRGLKMILTEDKQAAANVAPVKLSAPATIKLIEACENKEALKIFKSDERKKVKEAYDTKFNSFE